MRKCWSPTRSSMLSRREPKGPLAGGHVRPTHVRNEAIGASFTRNGNQIAVAPRGVVVVGAVVFGTICAERRFNVSCDKHVRQKATGRNFVVASTYQRLAHHCSRSLRDLFLAWAMASAQRHTQMLVGRSIVSLESQRFPPGEQRPCRISRGRPDFICLKNAASPTG